MESRLNSTHLILIFIYFLIYKVNKKEELRAIPLKTDASELAIVAVLSQEEKPVTFIPKI